MTWGRVPSRWSAIWREAGTRGERRRGPESLSVSWVEALLELRLLGITGRCWASSLRWLWRALRRKILRSRSRFRSLAGNRSLHASEDGRVIWYPRGLMLWGLFLLIRSDANILHIASSEHDVFVNAGGRRHLICRISTAPFGAE
jgi:hypothetical protein